MNATIYNLPFTRNTDIVSVMSVVSVNGFKFVFLNLPVEVVDVK